jgi:hypothetical protein
VRAAIQNLAENLLRFVNKHMGRELSAEAWATVAAFDAAKPSNPEVELTQMPRRELRLSANPLPHEDSGA